MVYIFFEATAKTMLQVTVGKKISINQTCFVEDVAKS